MHNNFIRAMDAHIHLDQYTPEDQQKLLSEAAAAGVSQVVAVSMRYDSTLATHALAQAYPEQVIPAYGFHPEQPLPSEESIAELLHWIREHQDERFAIGEVGLPYYNRIEAEATGQSFELEGYIKLLDRFVQLAHELDRPIVLHAVYEDADIACDLLEKHQVTRAHFHWFKGAPHTVDRMIRNGYFISITPDVCYESEIQDLVRAYPIEQLMVETDGPWPFEGPFMGQQTHPKMVLDVIRVIADLKSIPVTDAASILYNNTVKLYT
ncbi:TatD family hydrolase [Paenibacillus guangzhouensis]|uniref:TatD family hydrolase n=1 Tax=Paenibacillus guangzhouensis TaxID=1473112 RepID=UPI0012674092|nr:TatD family hydrolase [Paenibacillus guangzhouensis]